MALVFKSQARSNAEALGQDILLIVLRNAPTISPCSYGDEEKVTLCSEHLALHQKQV